MTINKNIATKGPYFWYIAIQFNFLASFKYFLDSEDNVLESVLIPMKTLKTFIN